MEEEFSQQPQTPQFPQDPRPKTWLVESILVTLFCCAGLPFGIAGIVNAAGVDSKYTSGDIAGAQRASKQAKKWTMWALIIGIIGAVLYIILVVVLGIGSAMLSSAGASL